LVEILKINTVIILELNAMRHKYGEIESSRRRYRITWIISRNNPVKAETVVEFTTFTSFVSVDMIFPD